MAKESFQKSMMRTGLKIVEDTKRIIDENGVLSFQEDRTIETKYIKAGEPDFLKIYFEDIMYFVGLPMSQSSILFRLMKQIDYDGRIILNSSIKKQIAEELKIKAGTIDGALTSLVKKKILQREDKGIYLANPFLMGRGKWQDIVKIRLEIGYSPEGRIISNIDIKNKNEQPTSQEDTDN